MSLLQKSSVSCIILPAILRMSNSGQIILAKFILKTFLLSHIVQYWQTDPDGFENGGLLSFRALHRFSRTLLLKHYLLLTHGTYCSVHTHTQAVFSLLETVPNVNRSFHCPAASICVCPSPVFPLRTMPSLSCFC